MLTYEVDQILVTLPSDIEPLRIVRGKDYVTLYTCTPYGINTHRLLVRGHRIETPGEAEEVSLAESLFGRLSLWEKLAVVGLLLLFLILIIMGVRKLLRRLHVKKE